MEEIRYSIELEASPEEQEQWIKNPITAKLFSMCQDHNKTSEKSSMFIGLQFSMDKTPEEASNKCILHFGLLPKKIIQ